jgi:2-oxoglutarate dehydrogenase complex dehydrogenase (E1) component-like enzyme
MLRCTIKKRGTFLTYRRSHPSLLLNIQKCAVATYEPSTVSDEITVPLKMLKMIYAFRNRGHFAAKLDPLIRVDSGRVSPWLPEDPEKHPDVVRLLRLYPTHLDLRPFGLDGANLSKKYYVGNEIKSTVKQVEWTVPELVSFLSETYCGSVGFEYAHIDSGKRRFTPFLAE